MTLDREQIEHWLSHPADALAQMDVEQFIALCVLALYGKAWELEFQEGTSDRAL